MQAMTANARLAAIQLARAKVALKPVSLDTETTGLGADAEIVEICVLDHDGRVLIDTLVRPRNKIPPIVIGIHGITNAMVATSPTWREVWGDVAAALADRHVAIYNASFDVRMLRQSNAVHRLRWNLLGAEFFCVMEAYAQFCGQNRRQKLEVAGRQCKIKLPNAHRARADALLAREVLQHMASCKR